MIPGKFSCLALMGSPRKGGNTALLLDAFCRGFQQTYSQAFMEIIPVAEKRITPCRGCDACKGAEKSCIIKDDMQEIYSSIERGDMVILASPIYWWHMTAQLKSCVDRFYGMDYSLFQGKKIVFLSTFGSTQAESGFTIACDSIASMACFLGMDFVLAWGISTGELSLKENPIALKEAERLGREFLFT